MQAQAVPFQEDLGGQTVVHWTPSQEVPEGQLMQAPLLRKKGELQTQVLVEATQAELAGQGRQGATAEVCWNPELQTQLEPFHSELAGQLLHWPLAK
jgi:hypothetical protein